MYDIYVQTLFLYFTVIIHTVTYSKYLYLSNNINTYLKNTE